jgi:replicative DNA helicase
LGFPNGGKTTLMINFAANMAKIGYKICYVTIESDDEEISERILSKESGISGEILKRGGTEIGGLTDEVMNRVLHTVDEMKANIGKNLTYITVPQKTSLKDIFARIERKRKFGDFDAVFVDYLDVIGHATRHEGRPDLDIADTSMELQAWGKQRGIFVWTAQSIKNEKIKEFRKKDFMENPEESTTQVGVEDAGGSQKLSRDPDYVVAVVPHPDGDKLVIFVTKARYDCPAGTRWICDWDKGCCMITDHEEFYQSANTWQKILKGDAQASHEEVREEAAATT